jgi:hypothetical protein
MINTTFRDKEVQVKERLSLGESVAFADYVVNFVTDIEELTYSPIYYDIALIRAFLAYYVEDFEMPSIQEVDEHIGEYQKLIEDVINTEKFNATSYTDLIDNIGLMIRFNKDVIVQKQSNDVAKLVKDLLNEQLETTKLQKKAINDTLEMNKKFQKKDIDKIVRVIDHLNKNMKNPAYQKAFVDEIASLKDGEE